MATATGPLTRHMLGYLVLLTLLRGCNGASVFYNLAYHASIVLDNYLYIDGGSSSTGDGHGNVDTVANNYTYSIDLTTSWTNSTVELNEISKGEAPVLSTEALWPDAASKTFYAYGGGPGLAQNGAQPSSPPVNALWQFTPSGSGSGSWSQAPVIPDSTFNQLSRTKRGTYGASDGVGFSLGGEVVTGPSTFADDNSEYQLVPGLVVYNDTSQSWSNVSSKGYSSSGYSLGGAAQFISGYGTDGLLFVLGGLTTSTTWVYGHGTDWGNFVSFGYAYMYDPVTKEWQSQETTGDIPAGVASPCIVGVQGENSYEIFLYGGFTGDVESTVAHGVVYVLSLPAFRWFRQDANPTIGRWQHSCNVVSNTRQMISVGGIVVRSNSSSQIYDKTHGDPDPWPQGLGVFDMTDMVWASEYNPSAGSYITPNIVKAYYKSNSEYPASWSDSTIKSWFTKSNSKQAGQSTSSSSSSKSSNSTNIGAIVGGVVGGVGGLIVIVLVIWLVRRHRNKPKRLEVWTAPDEKKDMAGAEEGSPELHGTGLAAELPAKKTKPVEVEGRQRPVEAGGGQVYELPSPTHEM